MEIRTDGPILVLSGSFRGEGTADVRRALRQQLDAPERAIVVDLTAVHIVDVPALTMLAFASHDALRTGHHVTLRGCSPAVRRMLHLTRLMRFVQLEQDAA